MEVTKGGSWGTEGMDPIYLCALWVFGPWEEMRWASEGYQKADDTCVTVCLGTLASQFFPDSLSHPV